MNAQIHPNEISGGFVLLGSVASVLSVASNTILLYAIRTHPKCYKCYFYFLYILAMLDIVVSLLYIPVIAFDHWKSRALAVIWWRSFRPLLAVTSVTMTTASFVILGAVWERYLITIRSRSVKHLQRNRRLFCLLALILALVTKGPVCLEFELVPNEDEYCAGSYKEFYVAISPIAQTILYGTVYRFWTRNVLTVFVPFLVLLFFHARTVKVLKCQMRQARRAAFRKFSVPVTGRKKVRAATITLLLVCLTYLLSNLPNVVVTVWEFIDIYTLQRKYLNVYTCTTDLVSVLVILACCLRLPIYMLSNDELRRVIRRACCGQTKATGELLKTASLLYTDTLKQSLLNGDNKS